MNRFARKIFSSLPISIFIFFIAVPTFCYAGKTQQDTVNTTDLGQKSFHLSISDGLVTLDAQWADLRRILEEISEKTGVAIEIGAEVGGSISASFKEIPLHEALKKITANCAMVFLKEGTQDYDEVEKVVVLASSQNLVTTQTKLKTKVQGFLESPPHDFLKQSPPPVKAASHAIVNEKTGIESEVVSNELIVRFKKGLPREDILALLAKTGTTIKTHIEALNYYVLSLPSHLSVNAALRWYREHGVVDQCEPNYLIPIRTIPNDPDFSRQWSLHNTGQTGGVDDAHIDAVEAWGIEHGKAEVVIAIIDTGVVHTHEDLAANIWHNPGEIPDNGIDDDENGYVDDTIGWDFVDSFGGAADEDFETPDNNPMDRHGHGTHVAGIAGAVTNNGLGIAGVAWNCKIMPVRAVYKTPSGGGVMESADASLAIVYAAENGARVINLSWGDYQKSELIEDAITFATNKGALVCAAAGNENSSGLIYPAASENAAVLAVGATDSHDNKALFSNYGNWVDVSAPGVNIYSTHLIDSYRQMSGTSMAVPHVTGVAALVFSYSPDISPLEVKTRIMHSVDVFTSLNGKNSTSGRVNTYAALMEACNTPHIFSLSPNAAHEEEQLTIFGDSFGIEQGNGLVMFYPDKEAEIISWSNSTIVCRVPEGAQTGNLTVTTSDGKYVSIWAFIGRALADSDGDGLTDVIDVISGDINNGGSVDLADAIQVLQVVSGITPTQPVHKEADVNNDGKIGLAEGLYVLQSLAGLRSSGIPAK